MKPKDDPDVAPWIAKRDEDLEMMAVALEHAPRLRDAIAFHAQQAAEKSMKALLAATGVEPPHVHDLVFLLEEIQKVLPVASISARDCQFLTPFATMARYPRRIDLSPPVEAAPAACRRIVSAVDSIIEAG